MCDLWLREFFRDLTSYFIAPEIFISQWREIVTLKEVYEEDLFYKNSTNIMKNASTPWKFNIVPEQRWLEHYFSFETVTYQGRTVKLLGSNYIGGFININTRDFCHLLLRVSFDFLCVKLWKCIPSHSDG